MVSVILETGKIKKFCSAIDAWRFLIGLQQTKESKKRKKKLIDHIKDTHYEYYTVNWVDELFNSILWDNVHSQVLKAVQERSQIYA